MTNWLAVPRLQPDIDLLAYACDHLSLGVDHVDRKPFQVFLAARGRGPYFVQGAVFHLELGVHATLVVGPEGGLSDKDLATLAQAGFRGLRLGPRILRTETAGLAAVAALQAIHGDL